MADGYYGRSSDRYKNTRITMTGSEISARAATPAAGSTAFEDDADGSLVPARRIIIVNFGANAVTAKIVTLVDTASAASPTTTTTADPITIPAGDARDTYGTLRNISDVLLTGTAADAVEIFQLPMQKAGAF